MFVGVINYPNGEKYDGDWVNDKRDGQGIYYCKTNRYNVV